MSEQKYTVEVLSEDAAAELVRRLRSTPENMAGRRTMVLPGGFELSGEFSLTARDVRSGEVAWEHSEKNLITDFGRRVWMEGRWASAQLAFAPSIETPQSGRFTVSTDGSQCFDSGGLTPTNAPATHTKTFTTTFGTPGSNRTLGTILLGRNSGAVSSANEGVRQVIAYALLSPPKTQTTVQTLEVIYRVSMNPIS